MNQNHNVIPLEFSFQFKTFVQARTFLDLVADLAEELNHHPDIVWKYNYVKLSVFTHSAGAVTDLDHVLIRGSENLVAEVLGL